MLESLNYLVDDNYTLKLTDFGLSRMGNRRVTTKTTTTKEKKKKQKKKKKTNTKKGDSNVLSEQLLASSSDVGDETDTCATTNEGVVSVSFVDLASAAHTHVTIVDDAHTRAFEQLSSAPIDDDNNGGDDEDEIAACTSSAASSEMSAHMTQHVGTNFWMAPEMKLDQQYDEKVDVYSLALTIYHVYAMSGLYDDAHAECSERHARVFHGGKRGQFSLLKSLKATPHPPLPAAPCWPAGLVDVLT
jgi:serine/threonine protein kinase